MKNRWNEESDDVKFKLYLKDFKQFYKNLYDSSEKGKKTYKEFTDKISSDKDTDDSMKGLADRISEVKTQCNEEENLQFDICIENVNQRESSIPDNEMFEAIIMNFVKKVTEVLQ